MSATEFWIWWYTDEATGKRLRTTYKMTRKLAIERFGEVQPVPGSMELCEMAAVHVDPNEACVNHDDQ
jgi:hypothetical protein